MTEFRRFVCWSAADALEAIGTEAVHASRAVFLSTHAPLKIRKRSLTKGATVGTQVAERDVLHDFLRRDPAGGVLLMPVVGESGTGKSHLVRWVKENLPPAPSRKIVYLKKTHTNLSAAVHELLAGLEGPLFDEIRHDIDKVTADLDETSLAHQLLDSLAFSMTFGSDGGEDESTRFLASEHGLPALLHDVHFRSHFLRSGSLIPVLASHLVEGRQENQQDRALEFGHDDLPLKMEHTDRASQVARDIWRQLTNSIDMQEAALDLLNQNLDSAVLRASNLGGGRLQKAMLEIRKQLLRSGQELVLLVEDFALVQGVQRDLLDAITETSVREGIKVLAPVRTLMAVTTGYYKRIAETVRTRASAGTPYVYDLDVRFGSDVSDEDIEDFVGRYLNAARLGVSTLESDPRPVDAGGPNACLDCPVRVECHEGFGTDSHDVGLYPFNQAALLRAIRTRAPEDASDTFNPRAVLGEVVRHVLVYERDALQEGRFPDTDFRETYPTTPGMRTIDSELAAQVQRSDPTDHQRRLLLLEFWGDAPTSLINLPGPVHQVFDLPPLPADVLGDVPDTRPPEPTPATSTSQTDGIPANLQAQLDVVEAWASRKKTLAEDEAREIREIVRQAVIRRTQWLDPITHEPSGDELKSAWRAGSATVSIVGAATESRAKSTTPPIQFERSAENALFFKALLRIKAGYRAGSAGHLRKLAQLADEYSARLRTDVRRKARQEHEDLLAGIRASLLGAVLAGKITPTAVPSDMVSAVLNPGAGWSRGDDPTRVQKWQAVLDAHLDKRDQLTSTLAREFAVSQGRGRPRMVDVTRLLPIIEEAVRTWSWAYKGAELPPWVAEATSQFADLPTVLQAQHTSLRAQAVDIRALLPADDQPAKLIDQLREALTSAVEAGLASSIEDVGEEERDLDRALGLDWKVVSGLERDLGRYSDTDDTDDGDWAAILQLTGVDRGPDLALIQGFLERAQRWVQASLASARQTVNPDADAVVAELQSTLDEWKQITEEATDVSP
jgi:hypothetical protein